MRRFPNGCSRDLGYEPLSRPSCGTQTVDSDGSDGSDDSLDMNMDSEETVRRVARDGTLMDYLKTTNVALHKCPTIAKGYLEEAEHELKHCEGLERMYIISNYILVRGISLDKMLDRSCKMLVYKQHSKQDSPSLQVKAPGLSVGDFPQMLGAFYVKRMFNWSAEEMVFFLDDRKLIITDRICCPAESKPHEFNTLTLSDITLPQDVKETLAIPRAAEKFTYVWCPQNEYTVGGFLYLDAQGKPLAVNWLSCEPQGFAMCFKEGIPVDIKVHDYLQSEGRWVPISVTALRDVGAKLYSFVGPRDTLDGNMVADDIGGFVYYIEQSNSKPCIQFFPINILGEIDQHGTFLQNQDMAAAELPECPSSLELKRKVQDKLGVRLFIDEAEVEFARIDVPCALHPCMLYSLTHTPQKRVLQTKFAKAIASASFAQWSWLVNISFVLNMLNVCALLRASVLLRRREPVSLLCFGVLAAVQFKHVAEEVLLWYGLHKWGWLWKYIVSTNCCFRLVIHYLVIFLLVPMYQCSFQVSRKGSIRWLFAGTGCIGWVRLLWALRIVEVLGLGRRVLPILEAFDETSSFLIVTLFFFCASMQVSYSLTDNKLSDIFFDTYRMGFVGEMEVSLFFGDDDLEWSLDGFVHFFWYFFFSFIVMVSLANIFIGIIGNAYLEAEKRVAVTFVRCRVQEALERKLVATAFSDLFARASRFNDRADTRVWMCYPVGVEDEEDLLAQRQLEVIKALQELKDMKSAAGK